MSILRHGFLWRSLAPLTAMSVAAGPLVSALAITTLRTDARPAAGPAKTAVPKGKQAKPGPSKSDEKDPQPASGGAARPQIMLSGVEGRKTTDSSTHAVRTLFWTPPDYASLAARAWRIGDDLSVVTVCGLHRPIYHAQAPPRV